MREKECQKQREPGMEVRGYEHNRNFLSESLEKEAVLRWEMSEEGKRDAEHPFESFPFLS